MHNIRAVPSSRPRWKIGPHSTRNEPDGKTDGSGASSQRVTKGSWQMPESNVAGMLVPLRQVPNGTISRCFGRGGKITRIPCGLGMLMPSVARFIARTERGRSLAAAAPKSQPRRLHETISIGLLHGNRVGTDQFQFPSGGPTVQ